LTASGFALAGSIVSEGDAASRLSLA